MLLMVLLTVKILVNVLHGVVGVRFRRDLQVLHGEGLKLFGSRGTDPI